MIATPEPASEDDRPIYDIWSPGEHQPQEPLCPDCGYDLTGLPPGSVCPECGGSVGKDVIVFWGNGHGASHRVSGPSLLGILGAIAACAAIIFLWTHLGPTASLLAIGMLAIVVYIRSHLPADDRVGGPQQLRLGPQGFALRRGFGPVVWVAWNRRWKVELRRTFLGKPSLMIFHPLLGPLQLEQLLSFYPSAPRHEVHEAVSRVRDWISQAP